MQQIRFDTDHYIDSRFELRRCNKKIHNQEGIVYPNRLNLGSSGPYLVTDHYCRYADKLPKLVLEIRRSSL